MTAEVTRPASFAESRPHGKVNPGRHDPLYEDDRAALEAIGKTQAFDRRFDFWSALGFTVCISGTVQAYVTLGRPSYEPERWHAYITYAFVICLYTLLNVFGVKALHSLNLLGIGTHLGGYLLTIIIMLVYTKDKHSADYVFTTFLNSSGWSSNGVAFCTGLSTSLFGFGGLETAAHFSEEIKHLTFPVFWTALINAIITLPWLIVLLYCSGNIDDVLASKTGPVRRLPT
ncbi:polyamine transporter tpo5 [Neofusicoccum ribis]|uniref:Polyamine transporter tpo5 n=1 Tax=Neofusicoccum ribis TaxID=45134 RepID=A0ABR3SMN8_9PEZI